MNTQPYSMKKLDDKCLIDSFSCGDNEWERDIADFLIEDALLEQTKGLNVTWLCQKDNEIVGYTSLVSSTLKIELPKWRTLFNIGDISRLQIPCGLIAQFGVVNGYKRQGVGRFMLSFVRGAAIDSEFGMKLLTLHVHVENENGKSFWETMGFRMFEPASGDKYKFMVHDLF